MVKNPFRRITEPIRMYGVRKRLARYEAEKQRGVETTRKEADALCQRASQKTEGLCRSLVREAELTPEESKLLLHGLEGKLISARQGGENLDIAMNLVGKGLVDRLPSNKKTPLITRFILTGKGNCLAKLAAGETVSECDCSDTAVEQVLEKYAEEERKKTAGLSSY